jgi:uncharacterized membrane-anchored protein YhcB (DUF1043 family)
MILIGAFVGLVIGIIAMIITPKIKRAYIARKERKLSKMRIDFDTNKLTPLGKANLVKMVRQEVRAYLEELKS